MVKYYDVTENQLESKSFESGCIYYCTDSGNLYVDSVLDNTRHKMSNTVIFLTTEVAKSEILAPIPYKMYCVLETGSIYVYVDGVWNTFGGSKSIIKDLLVSSGELVVSNSDITSYSSGTFIPDSSVQDLVTSTSVTCSAGSATISVSSDYNISGVLYIN